MTRVTKIVVAVALGAVLFFAPLLPLSFLVKHGSTTDVQVSLAGQIDEEVMEAIVLAVRQHDKLGWSFREPERVRISVAEYFFTYDEIGILSIEPCVFCESTQRL